MAQCSLHSVYEGEGRGGGGAREDVCGVCCLRPPLSLSKRENRVEVWLLPPSGVREFTYQI